MRHITAWFERHKFLGNVLGGMAVIAAIYGTGFWAGSRANPDTPTAHIYCGVIASNPDGTLNEERSGAEFARSRELAFEQGGELGLEKARAEGERILADRKSVV